MVTKWADLIQSADRAQYDEALADLLDMSVLEGMSLAEYHRWARVVWSIAERKANMS